MLQPVDIPLSQSTYLCKVTLLNSMLMNKAMHRVMNKVMNKVKGIARWRVNVPDHG